MSRRDTSHFSYRKAEMDDIPAVTAVMEAAISELMNDFLSADQVEASHEVMGLDTQLIKDGMYYLILEGDNIVGCGGWSNRATLYGNNSTKGRDGTLLDPVRDAARIRAMYTHPGHVRRGIGGLIMDLCEAKAAEHGFSSCELMATLAGEPLYRSCGYETVTKEDALASNGVKVPLIKMRKPI
ncbi:GNAT family N-acetyltransferase [Kordiimonas aquimaris]|uniref:GNAT family N-acetyltransferase n=1 Tax=Kordiimonas aquimaris TaxID=707591 RepID=UPI0021D28549|nr:GNAT family N-acetyltransferase [Kordiimonas aquimaris]